MATKQSSTIAQILYEDGISPNFARLVVWMEESLSTFRARERWLDWSDDAIAIFDIDHCRIALALTENPGGMPAACLTVSAGPSPFPPEEDADHFIPQHLCSALVDKIMANHPGDGVLWAEAPGMVTSETLDDLIEALPCRIAAGTTDARATGAAAPLLLVPADRPAPAPVAIAAPVTLASATQVTLASTTPAPVRPAVRTVVPRAPAKVITLPERNAELMRVRSALYPPETAPQEEEGPSLQMRLAVHSLNATLIVVLLPVGAALTTYTLLRGADMRVTGRAMALAGFGLMLSKTGALAALIG